MIRIDGPENVAMFCWSFAMTNETRAKLLIGRVLRGCTVRHDRCDFKEELFERVRVIRLSQLKRIDGVLIPYRIPRRFPSSFVIVVLLGHPTPPHRNPAHPLPPSSHPSTPPAPSSGSYPRLQPNQPNNPHHNPTQNPRTHHPPSHLHPRITIPIQSRVGRA